VGHPAFYSVGIGDPTPGVKWLGHVANHSLI